MTTKHTPGPWTIQDLGQRVGYPNWHSFAIRSGKENVHLATVGNVDRYFEGKEQANACLIAAAPELLEACKAIKDLAKYGENGFGADIIKICDTAIAKTEGNL